MRKVICRSLVPLLLLVATPLFAQRGATQRVQVQIAPDHVDWKYAVGENAMFTVKATKDGMPLSGAKVNWSIGPEGMPAVKTGTADLTADGLKIDGGSMKEPGFLRLVAMVQDEGASIRGIGTAGFDPEKIKAVTGEPADFDQFWNEGKAALARIPLAPVLKPDPTRTTETMDSFEVSIQTIGGSGRGNSRIFGILTMPKAPGKYPALLRVPGAGIYPAASITRDHEERVISLSIGIHGIPLTMDPSVYQNLSSGALSNYQSLNLDSKERYYYRRVYLSCVRAIDYLTSLPNWDGKNVAVMGNSQGGALAIVTAALDPRVGALGVFHPALSDQMGYLNGRVGGWPGLFRDPEYQTKAKMDTALYYDVVNFAKRIKVPGIYTWGYNDETCAPTTTYAAFNLVTAPKILTLEKETGHTIVPPQRARINLWIQTFLKTGVAPNGVVTPAAQ
jgi:cephalosporin-C deacetylase-like acetyl esterase